MATPVADIYAALSGAPIFGGRYPGGALRGALAAAGLSASGSLGVNLSGLSGEATIRLLTALGYLEGAEAVPNDVSANVWYPTKTVGGTIKAGSWANLPLNSWCKVNGSTLGQLESALTAAGFPMTKDLGNGKVVGSINAYSGGVLANDAFYMPRVGGHADSSMNGIWRLDLEKMGGGTSWGIEAMPSDPDAPGFVWRTPYKTLADVTSFSIYSFTPSDTWDVLPDGKPTSAHIYNGCWYDPSRNTINTSRMSKWSWDLTNKAWTRSRWTDAGTPVYTTINGELHYRAANDRVYGHFSFSDVDYYSWSYAPAGGVAISGAPTPTDWNAKSGTATARIGDTILALWHLSGEKWGIFNMATNSWTSGSVTSGKTYDYNSELMVTCYVPEWNKVIRRGTANGMAGSWWQFDLATKTNQVYAPAGFTVPFASSPGNKCFYYPARKCVVYITATSTSVDAVYVMRVG